MKKILAVALISMFIVTALSGCGSKRDVTHDPNGFLGYSDSFWEWQMKQ